MAIGIRNTSVVRLAAETQALEMRASAYTAMTKSVEQLLKSFEQLSEAEKRELASEIIKRSLTLELPELLDESLLLAADQTFLRLDKEESIHE